MKKVLVLSSAEVDENIATNNEWVEKLNTALQDSVQLIWCNYHNIRIEFINNELIVSLVDSNEPLEAFDFVYFKSTFRYTEIGSIIAKYLRNHAIKFASSEVESHNASTKLSQYSRLSGGSIPIIDTLFMLTDSLLGSFDEVQSKFGTPFILKAIDGAGGRDNFLINNYDDFTSAIALNPKPHYVVQRFVPNDCDYRVLIVGGSIRLIIRRTRIEKDLHLNNTSQGADAELVDPSEFTDEVLGICLQSAKLLGRETAGVDLMFNKDTHQPVIVEVNASPQIATGAFIDEKLEIFASYFQEATNVGK